MQIPSDTDTIAAKITRHTKAEVVRVIAQAAYSEKYPALRAEIDAGITEIKNGAIPPDVKTEIAQFLTIAFAHPVSSHLGAVMLEALINGEREEVVITTDRVLLASLQIRDFVRRWDAENDTSQKFDARRKDLEGMYSFYLRVIANVVT